MTKYLVAIKEVHISYREVEADSHEEALEDAGEGTEVKLVYHDTLPQETWTIEEVKE